MDQTPNTLHKKRNSHAATKGHEYTLEEIAVILGVTKERVRQIERQALKKLKSPNIGKRLKGYLFD